ncbi:MAG TPA: anthranilate synthase component I family protein [Nitrospirota bacterium]|nr:anthranilate synthase component I family protein [Nitrospirota bacterium]
MKNILPSKSDFIERAKQGKILPLYAELDLPSLTPRAALEAFGSSRPAALFESARVNEKTGRYSFVTAEPYLIFRSRGDDVELELPATPAGRFGRRASMKKKPLQKLRELLSNYRVEKAAGLPPFTGGAIGFFSYDFVHQIEKLPRAAKDDLGIPEAYFIFVDMVIAFDHILNKVWVIVNPGAREQEMGFRRPEPDQWDRLYDEAADRLSTLSSKLIAKNMKSDIPLSRKGGARGLSLKPNMAQADFESMVRRCKKYISAGDIYQANLSQRLSAKIGSADPLRLYTLLREINPSPFAAFLDFGDLQLVSSSPERLIRLRDGIADTRPIAGTRRRGNDDVEKQELSVELLTNEKERAEHIMLLDLERNDLGKVCTYGSVRVDEMMVIEDYSHVIHIVSNVRGELAQGRDCFDLIRAVFPGGTITGVPKVRCMEIIDELEPVARGPYTGSIGYISNAGDMDLNIIIRTFVIKDGIAHIQVGAGIVADSDPEREYRETLQKAKALTTALERLEAG